MNQILVECKKAIHLPVLLFSSVIIVISSLLSTCYIDADAKKYSILEAMLGTNRLKILPNVELNWLSVWACGLSGWTKIILPTVLAAGYLIVLSEERGNGAQRMMLLRENNRSYCRAKIFAAMVSGGVTLLLAEILFGIICYADFPAISGYSADLMTEYRKIAFPQGVGVFLFSKLLRDFIYGVFLSWFAVFTAVFLTDRYIVVCLPMMIHYGWVQVISSCTLTAMEHENDKLMRLFSTVNPDNLLQKQWDITQGWTIALMLLLYVIAYLLFLKIMKGRRDYYGVS